MGRRRKKTPKMEGVLDWFFRKGERPKDIFQAFGAGAPPPPPAEPLHGLPAPQAPGLPILRPEPPPAPARPSMFAFSAPPPPSAAGGGMIPAEPPAGPLMFRPFAPEPGLPAPAEPAAPQQPITWFSQEPDLPYSAFFGTFQEEPATEAPRFRAGLYSRGRPAWTITNWNMPSTLEITDLVAKSGTWDLNWIYEKVLSEVMTPWWRKQVEESSHYDPPIVEIDRIARKNNAFEDFSHTFEIPDSVGDVYFGEVTTEEAAREAAKYFMEEVITPLIERYEKSFDILRPSNELRGWFEISPDRTGDWWLTYREAKTWPQLGCARTR